VVSAIVASPLQVTPTEAIPAISPLSLELAAKLPPARTTARPVASSMCSIIAQVRLA